MVNEQVRVLTDTHTLVSALGRLTEIHKDPFDSILVAQATYEKRTLVSKDPELQKYHANVDR